MSFVVPPRDDTKKGTVVVNIRTLIVLLFLLLSGMVIGKPAAHFLVVPECMLSKKYPYEAIGELNHIWLIKTHLAKFQAARNHHRPQCNGFIDVTQAWSLYTPKRNDVTTFLQGYLPDQRPSDFCRHYKIQYREAVQALVQMIDQKSMNKKLVKLTSLPDRHVSSEYGLQAAKWVKHMISTLAAQSPQDIDIFEIPTINHAKQFSVVTKIGKNLPGPAIVIGAHLDTLETTHENKPGADDNASGTATVMEIGRVLMSSAVVFKKPIYLIWYAGEEEGLLGSQSVVAYFKQSQIEVDAVLNLDETGYLRHKEPGIGLTDDLTDPELTAFVADLVNAYVKVPVGVVRCGYACSDHAIWHQQGFRAVYPFTTMNDEGNPNTHTKWDRLETISLKHMVDFVKLGLAFAVELAEPLV